MAWQRQRGGKKGTVDRSKVAETRECGLSSETPESGLAVADAVHRPADEMRLGRSG